MKLQSGEIVDGKYRIVRLLGEGGMGAVYEGENQRINRRVAIKVLHASAAAKATAVKRFEQEAKAAGLIGSEHIVEVLDLGTLPTGEQYMVMEFLEGEDLSSRIKKAKRLTPHEAAPILLQLLEGLAAAHKAGIIHRDLKPDNVFLLRSLAGKRDFVKVLDFGVSKFSALETEGMSMTSTGAVVGTPYYLSPEQARGVKQIDARSDLYSVGVVLYQAVTGRLPFHAETFNELVFKIALESPEPAEVVVPALDPDFAAIIAKAMVRDVNGRFQTAEEFQGALSHWLATHPDPAADPVGAASARGSGSSMPPGSTPGMMPAAAPRVGAGTIPMAQMTAPQTGWPNPAPPQTSTPPNPYASTGSSLPMSTVALDPGQGMLGSPMPGAPSAASASSPQLGAPPAGLMAAAAPPKKTGAVVAVTAAVILALGGGAFAAYSMATGGDARGPAAPPEAPSASASAVAQTAPTSTAAAVATGAPTAEPSASAPPSAAPQDTTPAQTAAPPQGTWPPRAGTAPSGPTLSGAPTATGKNPTTPTTAPPKPTGRVIGGEL
jgi:serine/threonine-protein kinase